MDRQRQQDEEHQAYLLCRGQNAAQLAGLIADPATGRTLRYAAARALQHLPYAQIEDTVYRLLDGQYAKTRAAAVFVTGQMQTALTPAQTGKIGGTLAAILQSGEKTTVKAESLIALGRVDNQPCGGIFGKNPRLPRQKCSQDVQSCCAFFLAGANFSSKNRFAS